MILLNNRTFDCKFSDREDTMLIVNSCVLTYGLVKREKNTKTYDTSLWCLLVVVLILLIMLTAKEFVIKEEKMKSDSPALLNDIVEINEAANDVDDSSEARRQERTIKRRPYFMKDRRARSRSRRR